MVVGYPLPPLNIIPNPDKPERIATKALRHKEELIIKFLLRVFVSWWRKYFVR